MPPCLGTTCLPKVSHACDVDPFLEPQDGQSPQHVHVHGYKKSIRGIAHCSGGQPSHCVAEDCRPANVELLTPTSVASFAPVDPSSWPEDGGLFQQVISFASKFKNKLDHKAQKPVQGKNQAQHERAKCALLRLRQVASWTSGEVWGVSTHQDTVELCCHEGDPRLVDGLRKALVGQLQAAPRECVRADVTAQGASAVLDGKLGAVGLRSARSSGTGVCSHSKFQGLETVI